MQVHRGRGGGGGGGHRSEQVHELVRGGGRLGGTFGGTFCGGGDDTAGDVT
jgi:hypothetical protein